MSERVPLVTGGSSGIGEETARLLSAAGFATYAVARRVDPMAALARAGVHAVRDGRHRRRLDGGRRPCVLDERARIDVLVNNAGYGSYGAVEDVPIEEARRQFEVNVFGLARLTQLVTPPMRERVGAGSSTFPRSAVRSTSRSAVVPRDEVRGGRFQDSLRLQLAPFGIEVVIIEPGPILTEWNTISRDSLADAAEVAPTNSGPAGCGPPWSAATAGWAGTKPDVVARKIVKAATTSHPRPRYPVGRGAGSIVLARRLLPDRAFDAVVNSMYR